MYSFQSRIRYSETDDKGKLTLMSLLNYFQDCSIFHSEDVKLGLSYMKEKHLLWVLSAWQIVVYDYPQVCGKVVVSTAPYELKGFLGSRNFSLAGEDGRVFAVANSLWSLLDTDTGRPASMPQEMLEGFPLDERLDMAYAPRKIPLPKAAKACEPIVVRKHHLDANHHVNNGQYVQMAMAFLPADFVIGQMRAEYKKQAFLEDVLYPVAAEEADRYVVGLLDEQKKPYVIVEFQRMGAAARGEGSKEGSKHAEIR